VRSGLIERLMLDAALNLAPRPYRGVLREVARELLPGRTGTAAEPPGAVVDGEFREIPTSEGDPVSFARALDSADDFLGLVLGRPGTGKTAFCCQVLDRRHRRGRRAYVVGIGQDLLDQAGVGGWIREIAAADLGDVRDADLLIDDAARFLGSEDYRTDEAREFRLLVDERRHRHVAVLVNAQEGANVQRDALSCELLALKPSASFFPDQDRAGLREFLRETDEILERASRAELLHHVQVYSRFLDGRFRGLIRYEWPSWYTRAISENKRGR
jgi:hypothetical protein